MEKLKNIDWEDVALKFLMFILTAFVIVLIGGLMIYFGWYIKSAIKAKYIVKDEKQTYYVSEIVSEENGVYTMVTTDGNTLTIYKPAITEKK